MKENVRTELKNIINSRLVDIERGKNILYLTFEKEEEKYSLRVECPFRFLKDQKIIIASYSIYTYNLKNADINNLEYEKQNKIIDKKIEEMLNEKEVFVQNVVENNLGEIKIFFSNQFTFEVFNDSSDKKLIYKLLQR